MIGSLFFAVVAASTLQDAQTAPPPAQKTPSIRSNECRCPETIPAPDLLLEGLVVDAEVSLTPDGLDVEDRRATIFTIARGETDVKGRTKIWHTIRTRSCGVNFDYGKKYKIAVRKTEEGFETDACLMKKLKSESDDSTN